MVWARSPSRGGGARQLVGPPPPDVVLIFCQVGELQKVAEGPNHRQHGIPGQVVEEALQLLACSLIEVAVKAYRSLPDGFHHAEHRFPLLFPDCVPEQAAEQPDVLPQGRVFGIDGIVGVTH